MPAFRRIFDRLPGSCRQECIWDDNCHLSPSRLQRKDASEVCDRQDNDNPLEAYAGRRKYDRLAFPMVSLGSWLIVAQNVILRKDGAFGRMSSSENCDLENWDCRRFAQNGGLTGGVGNIRAADYMQLSCQLFSMRVLTIIKRFDILVCMEDVMNIGQITRDSMISGLYELRIDGVRIKFYATRGQAARALGRFVRMQAYKFHLQNCRRTGRI